MVQASNWHKIQLCWIGLGWVEFWNFWGLPDGWTCVLDVGVHGIVTNLLPSSLVWNHRLGSWKTATIAILVLATQQFCEHFAFLFSALRDGFWLEACGGYSKFVVWQGCWTNNPHYVRMFRPLWASLSDRYDTPHSHPPTILIAGLDPNPEVTISWAMLGLCNFQFTWWIRAFHSHFNTLQPTWSRWKLTSL